MLPQVIPASSSILSAEALAQRVLPRFGLDGRARCRFFRRSMSDVYLVETQAQAYFLKVYWGDRHPKESIEAEIHLLNDLRAHGIPVTAPVPDRDSNYLQTLGAPEGTRYAVLFHGVMGDEPRETNLAQSRGFGRLAARMHNCMDGLRRVHGRRQLDERYLIHEQIECIRPYLEHRTADLDYLIDLGTDLSAELCSLLPRRTPEYGLCHGDLHTGNARYDRDGELTLFDFDSFGYGWRAVDIGVYLVSYDWMDLSKEYKRIRDRFWSAFLEGYNQERPLSENEVAATRLCMPIRHLELMGLTIRYWSPLVGISWIDEHYLDRHIQWFKTWSREYRAFP